MVSREYIYQVIKSHHTIAVHMKGENRLDGLTTIIYVMHDLILDDSEERHLLTNISKCINTHGILNVKAVRTSEVALSL